LGGPGGTAKACAPIAIIIAAMTNATVTNNNKRLIMRYPLSAKGGTRQPRLALAGAS
jgi:hypothetical protein